MPLDVTLGATQSGLHHGLHGAVLPAGPLAMQSRCKVAGTKGWEEPAATPNREGGDRKGTPQLLT